MKKIFIIIIFAILFLPRVVFAQEERTILPDYSWYGTGEKEIYEISTEEQLLAFANIVNGTAEDIKKDTFKDKEVHLIKNLDLTGMVWTPIGSSMYDHLPDNQATKMFEGTFNGKYHTIVGLSSNNYKALTEDISSGEHSYGLFGYAYGANIKNISLSDVSISCSGEAGADGSGVAAVVGYYVPKDNFKSTIENVHVLSGNIQATNNMGGIIGYMEIKGENVNVDITIRNSTNAAKVTTDAREAGGILGLFQNADGDIGSLKFINCVNYGDITANSSAGNTVASGILGKEQSHSYSKYNFKVYFDNCINHGNITANTTSNPATETHVAGISTSYYNFGAPMIVNNCINTGNITILGPAADNFIDGIIAHPPIGEVNEIDAIIQNESYNLGTITGPKANTLIIKYDINGGVGNEASVRINSGSNVTLPTGSNLSKEGYIFTGWNTKIDTTGTNYAGGENIKFDSSTTLYAQWRKEKENWSVASIPQQPYTGKSIKPTVTVYDSNNNILNPNAYTVTYQQDQDCINVGKHILSVNYNNEIIELEYEIVKSRQELKIIPSSTEVKGNEKLELIVTSEGLNNIKIICDDSDVVINQNGDNKFTAIIPNKDHVYLFTAIALENENHFESSTSILVTGVKTNQIKNPETANDIYKTLFVLMICLSSTLLIKKIQHNN